MPELDFDKEVMPEELRGIEQRERRVEQVTGGEAGVRRIVERVAREGKETKEVGAEMEGKVEEPVVAAA